MSWKRKTWGGIESFLGFLLSPLSWWNDAFINLPLALAFGWLIAFFHPPIFQAAVITGYWLTNILGFWMLHRGIERVLSEQKCIPAGKPSLLLEILPVRRRWAKDLLIASAYTALILMLMKWEILSPVKELSF